MSDFDDILKIIGFVAGMKILADTIQNTRGLSPEKREIERLFNMGEYRASVAMSLITLESMLRNRCQSITGKDHSKDDLNSIIEALKDNKAIDNETYFKLQYFRNIRNSLMHSLKPISREEAQSITTLILRMIK
jgi:uncharacterized protein YutE (UPF0331/DUF86 family)